MPASGVGQRRTYRSISTCIWYPLASKNHTHALSVTFEHLYASRVFMKRVLLAISSLMNSQIPIFCPLTPRLIGSHSQFNHVWLIYSCTRREIILSQPCSTLLILWFTLSHLPLRRVSHTGTRKSLFPPPLHRTRRKRRPPTTHGWATEVSTLEDPCTSGH